MDLMLRDFSRGTGMFSPLAMSQERKLARSIGPALSHTLGSMYTSNVAANADIIGNLIRGKVGIKTAGMHEEGATTRQKMSDDASIRRQELANIGHQLVQQLANSGAYSREQLAQSEQMRRQKQGQRFQENILDDISIMKHRGLGRRTATPGGADMSVVDEIDSGTTPTVPQDVLDIFDPNTDW